jgi:hypothetical protein
MIEGQLGGVSTLNTQIRETGPRGYSAYEVYVKNGGTLSETEWLESLKGTSGVTDVQVDGVSVVTDGIANIVLSNVTELDEVLKDILEAIQTGISSSMIIEEIEQLIVSYFENKTIEEVEE